MNLAVLSKESDPQRGEGLYLRTNRSRPNVSRNLFRIRLDGQDEDKLTYRCEPGCVIISSDDGALVDLIFSAPGTLRIRSNRALTLESAFSGSNRRELASHAVACRLEGMSYMVNAKSWLRKYGLEVLAGKAELTAPWDGEMVSRADLAIKPDETGQLELALDEFWSTWIRPDRDDFDKVREQLRQEWRLFVDKLVSPETPYPETAEASAALIWMCTQEPSGIMSGEAIFMSLNWMDSVWSWDNWINMAGVVQGDPDLAYDQHRVIASHQDEFGAYPDAVNDGFLHFNFTKPPVQGLMSRVVERLAPEFWTGERLKETYPSVARFTLWWLNNRFSREYGLCYYLHGNDSGWDNGTLLRRGVPLISPDLNAFLAEQCDVLADWSERLGYTEETEDWKIARKDLIEAMTAKLWNGEEFTGIKMTDGEIVKSGSLMASIPAILSKYLPPAIRRGLKKRFDQCETEFGLASESPVSPLYEAENYWRGPIWAPSTLIGLLGLEELGETEQALRVGEKFLKLVDKSGFAENFNAETGAPLVDPGYTWTASVFLILANQEKNDKGETGE